MGEWARLAGEMITADERLASRAMNNRRGKHVLIELTAGIRHYSGAATRRLSTPRPAAAQRRRRIQVVLN